MFRPCRILSQLCGWAEWRPVASVNGKIDMAFKSLKKRWAADFVTSLVAGYDDSLWAGPLPGPLAVRDQIRKSEI